MPHCLSSTAGSGPRARCAGRSSFPSFLAGIDAVRRVAEHAEAQDHHPDIDIRWRTVTFALVTHSAGGITQNDIEMARDIDGILGD